MIAGNEKDYFEDCELGETMRSNGRTVSESDIYQFAGLTGDWNPCTPTPNFLPKAIGTNMSVQFIVKINIHVNTAKKSFQIKNS